nr:MAG TPA: hypothetical protein [Caudoviricetes sp.]
MNLNWWKVNLKYILKFIVKILLCLICLMLLNLFI